MIFRKVEIFALWLFLSLLLSCAPTISQNPSESNKPETGRETSISVSKNKDPKESKSSLPKQVEIEEEKLLHLKESPKAKKEFQKPAQQEAFSKKTKEKLGKEAKQTLDTVGPEQGGSEARESLVLKEKDSLPQKLLLRPRILNLPISIRTIQKKTTFLQALLLLILLKVIWGTPIQQLMKIPCPTKIRK